MKTLRLLLLAGCTIVLAASLGVAQVPGSPTADFVWPDRAAKLPPAASALVESVRVPALGAHIAFLASPGMEGRGLQTRGLDAAAEYIASTLALAGVPPFTPPAKGGAVTASYFHPVPLREISHATGRVTIESKRGPSTSSRVFLAGVDALFPEIAPQTLSAPVVFAGYGIRETKPSRDDYQGLDVSGKVVVLLAGLPPQKEWQAANLVSRYGAESGRARFAAKAALAASLGARAVIAIEGPEFTATVLTPGDEGPAATYYLSHEQGDPPPPVIRVSQAVGEALLGQAGPGRAAAPRALEGMTVTVEVSATERLVQSRNVVAMVPGADPRLRDEAIVVGAHMDHLGRAASGYYPGADDNASGTAALLEMARAFAGSPAKPKRTIIFAFWTGEEEGHLGSVHYVRHPLWPLDRTAVYLNLDMIGHPWTQAELQALVAESKLPRGEEFLAKVKPTEFVELGVADWAVADLGPVLAQAARGVGLALHFDATDGKNGGSDYRDFARHARPFVRFFGNYFDGYHEPTDTVEKLDVSQVLKMARLATAAAWLFADR